MKFGVVALGAIGLLGLSGVALAQTPAPRVGFQMDIRTGYSLPMGKANGPMPVVGLPEQQLSDISSGQVPLFVDIGAKVIPELFIGGYFGLAFGGAGGTTKAACELNRVDCLTVDVHFGVEAQYHILPAGQVNPWIGYGLGFESFALGRSVGGVTVSEGYSGFEFARFMAGVDFRLSRVVGVGPFADLAMTSFGSYNPGSTSVSLPETGVHEWLTLGVRVVFFP